MNAETTSTGVGSRARREAVPSGRKGTRRALVVDDNNAGREVLRRLLLAEEFECDTATSGSQALACFEKALSRAHAEAVYDVIFVDVIMPGIGGLELARLIRARDERVAIVVVTGVADTSRALEALRLGVDEYVVKPYSISTLRLAWEQAFERRRELGRQRRATRTRDEITDIIFHDLRNPLSVARGYLGLMEAAPGAVGPGDIRAAAQGCDLAIDIIGQGEDLGRIERSEFTAKRERLHLDEIVPAVVESLRPLAEGAGKSVRTVTPSGLPAVIADANIARRIVSDLTAGALKYASGETEIAVDLSTSGDGTEVLVAVTDDGLPVPPEFREAIFDKEQQGELRRAACRRGSGMALPFAREACRHMGARIWVEDAAGTPASAATLRSSSLRSTSRAALAGADAPASQATTGDTGCSFVVAFRAAPVSELKSERLLRAGFPERSVAT